MNTFIRQRVAVDKYNYN